MSGCGARTAAGQLTYEAGRSARIAGHARREQDWTLQSNAAACEINATFKQLRAAQLRRAMAEREWRGAVTVDALQLLRANGRC